MSDKRTIQLVVVAAFVGVNLIAPFLLGEFHPFSMSPMFCETIDYYCEYQAFDPDGNELPLEAFHLQQVYDGNPLGMGAGIVPAETINHFNMRMPSIEVSEHVKPHVNASGYDQVLFRQTLIEAVNKSVGESEQVDVLVDRTGPRNGVPDVRR